MYFYELYVIMNMSRKLEYNKKGNIQFLCVECLPEKTERHLSYSLKCHFFIVITKKVRRNKMMAMSFSTFIIKVLVFIPSNLLSIPRFGRHSTIEYSLLGVYYSFKNNTIKKHKKLLNFIFTKYFRKHSKICFFLIVINDILFYNI